MGARIAAFACGVIILYSGLFTPPQAIVVSVFCMTFLVAFRFWHRTRRYRNAVTVGLLAVLGLAWAALACQSLLGDRLEPEREGRELRVQGYLCDAPSTGAWGSVRFSMCLTGERQGGVPRKIRLSWYGDDATLNLPSPMMATVVLKRPHGAVNPGGFRYETWLFRQGYGATGTVRGIVAAPQSSCGIRCHYHRWRQQLVLGGREALNGMEHSALAMSLLAGYRGDLTNQQWKVLDATGTIHLVAISGLHLGLVAALAAFSLRWVALRVPRKPWSPRCLQQWVWTGVAILAGGYALMAGFTVPTRRALVMVVVAGWLIFKGRLASPWQGWLLALGAILALDPLSPLDQGFWLSFCAVAVLILVFRHRKQVPGVIMSLVVAQAAVFAGLWPVLSVLDQGAAWAGLIANIIAIPMLSLVVMPVLVVGGLVLLLVPGDNGGWVGMVFDGVLGALWWILETLGAVALPSGRITVMVALVIAGVVLLALWVPDRTFRWATMGVVLTGVIGLGLPADPRWQADPQLWVWDVGQGLSVLLHHQGEVLLYDTGPESASGYSAVSDVLLPSFERIGVHTVGTLVVSHGDQDHAGGLNALLQHSRPRRIISGEPERLDLAAGHRVQSCRNHDPITVGEVEVFFWQAGQADPDEANDRSCVVLLRHRNQQVLLPGDISVAGERQMLSGWSVATAGGYELTLVAPHHGSKTSSGPGFVNQLSPERVIFTAGYRHRYGHPHPDVVARYRAIGGDMFNTATAGALRLDFTPEGIRLLQWRERAPFWIRPPESLP